ncbi:hypothetical protein [Microvirga sp. TS319]|uniref:hypothetical protein n=1 Tax=Microvirga sp. TS319 TaxID=3241165 RepID=UPI00351A698E
MSSALSSALPGTLESDLAKVLDYWKDLIRGENSMPFSDDVDLSRLPDLSPNLLLLTAFENPDRFRFETAGEAIVGDYGTALAGRFSDEMPQKPPLEEFTEQCLMAVSQKSPTYFRSPAAGYARLVLPTWGEGHVMTLLGAVSKAP